MIGALWALVEYRVKQLEPWQVLRSGLSDASTSVLLDYVSPWNVISLFKSVKAKHFIVAISILATLLIRLLIVFSTGLLLLQDTFVENLPVRLTANQRFVGDEFNNSAVNGDAALIVAGTEVLGLQYPYGTNQAYAYQTFNVSKPSAVHNSTMTGSVDVFMADLDCQTANLQSYREACVSAIGCEHLGQFIQVNSTDCATEEFLAFVVENEYSDVISGSLSSTHCIGPQASDDTARLVISVGTAGPNATLNFTGVICKPFYQVSKQDVSLFGNGSLRSINISSKLVNRTIPGVTPWDIITGINSSLIAAGSLFTSWNEVYGANWQLVRLDAFFSLMNMTAPQHTARNLFNETLLYSLGRSVFRSLSVQIANQYLTRNANDEFLGNINSIQNRLLVHELSLRAMEGILAVLIIGTTIIAFRRRRDALPQDPGPINSIASILANSQSFMSIYNGTSCTFTKELEKLMTGKRYQTTILVDGEIQTFQIQNVKVPDVPQIEQKECSGSDEQWWQPFSVSVTARVVTLVIPVILIAVLEAVYQISHRHEGIANVTLDNYVHYSWVYVPAGVMLATRAVFDTVDFTARVFQPYCTLYEQSATPERGICADYLSKMSIHSLYCGLVKRHFGVACTSAVMFMAPFLTIVVSGLFTTKNLYSGTAVTTTRLDWFNPSQLTNDVYKIGDASLVSSLVMETELNYPRHTWDNLVFANFRYPPQSLSLTQSDTFQARLPALRASLSCSRIAPENIANISFVSNNTIFQIQVEEGCGDIEDIYGGQSTSADFAQPKLDGVNNGSYFGVLQNIQTSTSSCAPFIAVYGQLNGTSTDKINIVTCSLVLAQVEVDTTFSLPSYDIVSTIVDESSAYILPTNIAWNDIGPSNALSAPVKESEDVYDDVFSMLVHGGTKIQGTAMIDFMGANNTIVLSEALSHLFGIFWAQVLNLNARTTTQPSTQGGLSSATISGNMTSMNITRLQQQGTSTRILEGLLAAITICIALSFMLMKTDKVLPLNPCSIAASASLLAESRMMQPTTILFPTGSEWHHNGKRVHQKKLYVGRTFSLKWWQMKPNLSGDRQMRYGIDVDNVIEDEHRNQGANNDRLLVSDAWVDEG